MRSLKTGWARIGLLPPILLLVLLLAPRPVPAQPNTDFAAIDAFVTGEMNDSRIPGVALAILEDGRVVHAEGFGSAGDGEEVTAQTLFPIGSLTKSMTALSIMQLVEAGKVVLDAPVQTYLPSFVVADSKAASRITIRHLLNQTSGLSRQTGTDLVVERSDASLEETVRSLASADLNRPVGETYEYSNANFAVLSLVVQQVSRQPFGDYLDEHVFTPIGMDTATTSLTEAKARGLTDVHRYWFGMPVASELEALPGHEPAFVSADDMAAYVSMYLDQGRHDTNQILSPDGVSEMLTPATNEATRSLLGTDFTFRYGMGWFVGPFGTAEGAVWHLGELPSFNAWMVLMPEQGRAVVVLTNADSQFPWPGANEVMSRIPIGVVNILNGDPPPTGFGITRFYHYFDAIVLAIVALQAWALLRLARRPAARFASMRGLRPAFAAARRTVPLIWELGLGLGILLGYRALLGISLGASFEAFPDLTIVLMLVAALWLVTGLLRVARLGQSIATERVSSTKPAVPLTMSVLR